MACKPTKNAKQFNYTKAILKTSKFHNQPTTFVRSQPMSDRKFNIVFDGSVINGSDPLEVKTRVKQLFKLDDAAADRMFSGSPIVIKKNVDRKTATQFQKALSNAGARVQLMLAKEVASPTDSEQGIEQPAQTTASNNGNAETGLQSHSSTTSPENSWSVASAGGNILRAGEKTPDIKTEINTDHLELVNNTPENVFLAQLDDAEKQTFQESQPRYPEPAIDSETTFGLKSEVDIDNENTQRAAEIAALISAKDQEYNSQLQLSASGSTLLSDEERQKNKQTAELAALDISPTFDISEVGSDLLAPEERVHFEEVELDLSHIQLEPSQA